mmetsp:Transcript_15734/g.42257  ORF Transcript_15734/g.42257 Transcript_15734/m.42257 type:complete len:246 (-) Transcript_15734:998-1735(-)
MSWTRPSPALGLWRRRSHARRPARRRGAEQGVPARELQPCCRWRWAVPRAIRSTAVNARNGAHDTAEPKCEPRRRGGSGSCSSSIRPNREPNLAQWDRDFSGRPRARARGNAQVLERCPVVVALAGAPAGPPALAVPAVASALTPAAAAAADSDADTTAAPADAAPVPDPTAPDASHPDGPAAAVADAPAAAAGAAGAAARAAESEPRAALAFPLAALAAATAAECGSDSAVGHHCCPSSRRRRA